MKTQKSFRKKALLSSVAMLLVATVAVGSATFAWFTNNTTATAQNLEVTVSAPSGLLINTASTGAFTSTLNLSSKSASLTPVSGDVADDAPTFRVATVNDSKKIEKCNESGAVSNVISIQIFGKLSSSNKVDNVETPKDVKLTSISVPSATDEGQVVRTAFYSASNTTKKTAYCNFGGSARSTAAINTNITSADGLSVNDNWILEDASKTTTYSATNGFGTATKVGTAKYATSGELLGTLYVWVEGQDELCNNTNIEKICKSVGPITVQFDLAE